MKLPSFIMVSGLLVVVACGEAVRPDSDTPSAPTVFAAPPAPTPCSFKDAKDAASAYFKLRTDRQTAADLLKDAEQAGAGTRTRNDRFFDVFQLIESARAAGQVNAGSFGASLILEADDCGEFIISHRDANLPAVLAEALTGGAWTYRLGIAPFAATADGGAALFTADWTTWIGGRSMVFIARTSVGFTETPISLFAYRMGLVYDDATTGFPATAGPSGQDDIASMELCDAGVTYEAKHRVGRVKSTGGQTVLQLADITGFCDGLASTATSQGFLARAFSGVVSLFAPTPLQARRRAPPGMGGGIGELSDFIGVDAGAVSLAFTTQPVDGDVDLPFVVRVLATAAQGTALENVAITVTVTGNQGEPAGAFLVPHPLTDCGLTSGGTPSLTVNTDETGTSTFCVRVDKPGGYRIGASSSFAGYPGASVGSNSFNRTP